MLQDFNWTAVLQNVSYKMIQSFITVKPPFTDISLLRTVCFVPGKRKPFHFSKFNPLNMDTPLKWTLPMAPSMFVFMGFDSKNYINYLLRTE